MVTKMSKEELIQSIQLIKRYESYKILKLWGITLITIPLINIIVMLLFDAWIIFARNFEIIYSIVQALALILITVFFLHSFLSIRKLEIREKEIVSSYYVKLGFALLGIFLFFAVLFMIAVLIEAYTGPFPSPYRKFPFVLGGYLVKINGIRILVYWGDNLALLIGYILLRNKNEGLKFIELPISITFLTIYDILIVTLVPYLYGADFLEEYFLFVSSFVAVSCGIISLTRAYKYLKNKI